VTPDLARADSAAARIAAVARKEAIDIFRDRRAILVTLVTAIVAGPVMILLVLNLVARQADRVREMTLPVVGGRRRVDRGEPRTHRRLGKRSPTSGDPCIASSRR